MVTCKDIAKKAGVSPATVARAFASPDLVSEKTKKKIFETTAKLHYTPNAVARSLRSTQSDMVGLIISDIRNPFFTQIGYSLQEKLKEKNLRLVIHFSNENPESEEDGVGSILSSRVNSVIFTPATVNNHIPEKLRQYNAFGLQLFRRAYNDIDSIVVDDEAGTCQAVKKLLAENHRKILLLDGWSSLNTKRPEGYLRAFSEAGLTADPDFIQTLKLDTDQTAHVCELIRKKQPTAVISVSEKLSYDLVSALKTLGLAIKRDVSVIFYDDCLLAAYLNISVVRHNTAEIINAVIGRLLIETSERHAEVSHTVLQPYLLERDSIIHI